MYYLHVRTYPFKRANAGSTAELHGDALYSERPTVPVSTGAVLATALTHIYDQVVGGAEAHEALITAQFVQGALVSHFVLNLRWRGGGVIKSGKMIKSNQTFPHVTSPEVDLEMRVNYSNQWLSVLSLTVSLFLHILHVGAVGSWKEGMEIVPGFLLRLNTERQNWLQKSFRLLSVITLITSLGSSISLKKLKVINEL